MQFLLRQSDSRWTKATRFERKRYSTEFSANMNISCHWWSNGEAENDSRLFPQNLPSLKRNLKGTFTKKKNTSLISLAGFVKFSSQFTRFCFLYLFFGYRSRLLLHSMLLKFSQSSSLRTFLFRSNFQRLQN